MEFTEEEIKILKLMVADVKAKMVYAKEREAPNTNLETLKNEVIKQQNLLKEGC